MQSRRNNSRKKSSSGWNSQKSSSTKEGWGKPARKTKASGTTSSSQTRGGRRVFKGPRLKPSKPSLIKLLDKHGVQIKPEQVEKLWAFHQLLRENNKDGDLSRLRAFETIVERHYADCILMNKFIKKWPQRMLDIGCGAGFPGFPLKITNPQIHLTLCEPRPRRVDFLNMVIEKLDLKNIDVFGHKVTSNSMDIPVDGIVTRAFEHMEKTLLRIEHSLKPGGQAIFMKGPAGKDEVAEFDTPGYSIKEKYWYTIPNSTQDRSLIVVQRDK